jgi:hypothetical protein
MSWSILYRRGEDLWTRFPAYEMDKMNQNQEHSEPWTNGTACEDIQAVIPKLLFFEQVRWPTAEYLINVRICVQVAIVPWGGDGSVH